MARQALRDSTGSSGSEAGEASLSSWGSALLSSQGSGRRSRSDEASWGRPRGSEDAVWHGLRALEALESAEELDCGRLAASYDSLRQAAKAEAVTASAVVTDSAEQLQRASAASRRAEMAVRRCRASVAKAKDAASQTEAERLEAARLANEALAKAVRDVEALPRHEGERPQKSSRGGSMLLKTSATSPPGVEAARKASVAAERARSTERRCADKVKEAYARVGRETSELRAAADAAIAALREQERRELSVADTTFKIQRDVARPRALEALREIARYERGHLEAKLARLDDLDRALERRLEPPARRRPTSQRRARPLVGRALELLRDCLELEYYSKHSNDEARGDEDAIDEHVAALFDEAPRDPLPALAAPRRSPESQRADALRDAAQAAGFDRDGAGRLAGAVLAAGGLPRPLEHRREPPPAARALVAFVEDSGDRAAAVARSLNRQRSKRTAAASLEALEALAFVASRLVEVCCARGDAHTPGVILMLSQTFFVDGAPAEALQPSSEPGTSADDDERRRRVRRVYLKDKLDDDFRLRHDDRLWRACIAEAALNAVASTTVHYRPYWDVVFAADQAEVVADVHRCVHAQLAAFLFAMRDLGAPKDQVRKFALAVAADYQLPCRDRLDLLGPYENDDDDDDQHQKLLADA